MKSNVNAYVLFLLLVIFTFGSCGDNFEPSDILLEETNEEMSADENDGEDSSTDDDDENSEETGDSRDDETNDDNTNDETGDENTGDENTEDENTDDENTGDETEGENTTATILGDWELVSATIDDGQASTMVENSGVINFPFSSSSKDENAQVAFSENPNVVNGNGQYTNIITYTLFSQTFTDESILESPITNGSWQQSENDLTITGDQSIPSDFVIKELSANTMILEVLFDRTIPVGELEVEATGTLVIEFNRI